MSKNLRKSAGTQTHIFKGHHRFEHWYADNQVYLLTARCRDQAPAFASEQAKAIFWDRFNHYTQAHSFTPWVTSLLDNHYHTLGYLKHGQDLGPMMQRIHGSVSKRVNDTLDTRLKPFWREAGHQTYFDGCIRDEQQARKAYRYTCIQSQRHKVCDDWTQYPHTRINIELERAIKRANELKAYMTGVPYKRYDDKKRRKN
ncbi:MAG: hypothetical protein AAGA29_10890 [Planctomycetota bacterium]